MSLIKHTRRCCVSLAALLALAVWPASALRPQEERCGVAKDLVVQALERIKNGDASEVENGLQLLKDACDTCASFGDAWYYRGLFEEKLGHAAKAKYSRDKAKLFGSEAMDAGATPFVLAAPPRPGANTLPPLREKWALVIGVSQFHDASLNLQYTGKDAKDFAAALSDPNAGRFKAANVHVAAGAVTTRKIKEELNWLARMAREDDLVVIFLATHGTPRAMDTAEVNYVVTSDTDLQSQDQLFASALAMVELSDIVRTRVAARRTVIFLDTCHSGAAAGARKERVAARDASPSSSALERIRQGVGRAILTSSQEDQVSYEGAPFQNGYFTHFLLAAIRQNGGMSTMQQLYDYLKDQLPQAVAARSRGMKTNQPASQSRPQTPLLSVSESGAGIVLGAPPVAGAASAQSGKSSR